MKKLYESPDVLLTVFDSADIITESSLRFSNQANAEIDQKDIHSFDLFFN